MNRTFDHWGKLGPPRYLLSYREYSQRSQNSMYQYVYDAGTGRGLIKCKHFLEHPPIREERNGGGLGELLDWAATLENCLHFNRKLYVFMNLNN